MLYLGDISNFICAMKDTRTCYKTYFILQRTEVLHLKDCPRKISEGLRFGRLFTLKEGTVEILKLLTNRLYDNEIYHAFM